MRNNPVLDANLNCIAKYNPNLKYKILQLQSLKNEISIVNTVLQEPNLMFNGVYLHNNYGAESEAKELFSKVENDFKTIHVLFGFGLGYLVQIFAFKSEAPVFIYEPCLEILAATLEVADLSKELSQPNVFVFTDFEELKKCYSEHFIYNSSTVISFLPSYKTLFKDELDKFAFNMKFLMGSNIIDCNYVKGKLLLTVKSVCSNIDLVAKEKILGDYRDIYKGKTAVIVSAGPSLDKNIDVLKKYRDNVIVISVGQAARTLFNNGIKPDFIVMLETYNQISQLVGLDLSDVDFVLEPLTYSEIHSLKTRNKISYPSHTSVANLIWTDFSGINPSEYVSIGTVSYTALYVAKILGFKNLVLVGQDLAFVDGKCYSNDSAHKGLIYKENPETGNVEVVPENFEEFKNALYANQNFTDAQKTEYAKGRLDYINKNLFYVKGIKGNNLPTSVDYASFIATFEDFAQKNNPNEHKLYNTSLEGAQINGFENVSLEEIIKDLEPVKRLDLNIENNLDINSIINNIKSEMNLLSEVVKIFTAAESLISRFDKEYHNRKQINENCIKTFKQLMVLYIDTQKTYCQKSRIYSCLQQPYTYEIEYAIKSDKQASPDSIYNVYKSLKIYVTSVHTEIKEVLSILKSKVENLNEMSNSKS